MAVHGLNGHRDHLSRVCRIGIFVAEDYFTGTPSTMVLGEGVAKRADIGFEMADIDSSFGNIDC